MKKCGREIQESVAKHTEVVDDNFDKLVEDVRKVGVVLAQLSTGGAQVTQSIKDLHQMQENISYLNSLCVHVKLFLAAFFAYKVTKFVSLPILLFAAGYVRPQFLPAEPLATFPNEVIKNKVLRGTKLFLHFALAMKRHTNQSPLPIQDRRRDGFISSDS